MKTCTIENEMICDAHSVKNIDLSKVIRKLMLGKEQDGESWSFEKIEVAEREYKRFFMLVYMHPNEIIVPNKLMDEMWHKHILDTRAYRQDCLNVFGTFIDHYPYYGINGEDDHQNLERDFEKTKVLYFKAFGEEMDRDSVARRCQGHACHAVSSCACRVPGTCK